MDCLSDGEIMGVVWREMKALFPGDPHMMAQSVMAPINQDTSFISW